MRDFFFADNDLSSLSFFVFLKGHPLNMVVALPVLWETGRGYGGGKVDELVAQLGSRSLCGSDAAA
jgi:hypothetical protein